MKQLIFLLITLLLLCLPKDNILQQPIDNNGVNQVLTPMEALDFMQQQKAVNYEKIFIADSADQSYYYKLPGRDYYLAYEGLGENPEYYMIHLYEFVTDDPELGIGHTVTYGWYTVDKNTGEIIDEVEY